jgi:acetate kinase
MGMSPQSGVPNNNRVGDFDPFAIPVVMAATGMTLERTLYVLAEESGLKGLSGAGNDLRDIEAAAAAGNARAKTALDVFIASVRDWIGVFLARLGGVDALVFTGGIGENSVAVRAATCAGWEEFGIALDPAKNAAAKGEAEVGAAGAKVRIWTLPTNEEIVVARQTAALLASSKG